jgi:catechol 2,3-dioxygenase-like lactoylglutathione lyase family enzyme
MQILDLDHLVLTVNDIDATCAFYGKVLGMQIVTFGDNRKALHFGNRKINLHETGKEFEPKAAHPAAGAMDICLLADGDIEQIMAHLRTHSVEIVQGPVRRTGATGPILSVYVRDPDKNLLEIATPIPES